MKKIILLFILFILNSSSAFSQTGWNVQNFSPDSSFISLSFINNLTGYVYSNNGLVYRTTNLGNSWSYSGYCTTQYAEVIKGYANSNMWYFLTKSPGPNYQFRKSTDFSYWLNFNFPDPPSTPPSSSIIIRDVEFINNNGYAIGFLYSTQGITAGLLYHSTISGHGWNCIYQKFGNSFTDFYIKNDNTIALLENSAIHRSTNGGNNWTIQNISGVTSTIYPVSFTNPFENVILFVCTDDVKGKIMRSSNGGNTWDSVYSMNSVPKKIHFNNSSNSAFVIGSNGLISKSSDGGLTWQNQNSGTNANLTDIYAFNKDTVFISTSTGQILKTVTGGTVGIQQVGSSIPEKFILHQNYPNPFNPVTKIKFEIAAGAINARLFVYDLSGKQVAVLVNSKLSSGVYEVDFNAQNLASGVYYYKLITNNYTEVKKMMLVK